MIRLAILLLGLGLAAPVAAAQSVPDSRLRTMPYTADQPIALNIPPSSPLTVMLEPGERMLSAMVSDPAAFAVTLSAAADCLFIRTNQPDSRAMVTVRTDRRDYLLAIASAADQAPYYLAQIVPGIPAVTDAQASSPIDQPPVVPGRYRLFGNRELRPSDIRDDGQRAYLQWAPDQALPAIFAVDRLGREEMVDSYMRNGWLTIDRIYERLIFRIDKVKAEARRVTEKAGK